MKDNWDGCNVELLRPDWPYAMFPVPRLLLCSCVPEVTRNMGKTDMHVQGLQTEADSAEDLPSLAL